MLPRYSSSSRPALSRKSRYHSHTHTHRLSLVHALYFLVQDKNCHCTRERDVEYKGCGWNWQARQQVEQRKHMYMGQVAAMQQHYYQQLQHQQQVCLSVCMSMSLPLCVCLYAYVCMHAYMCAFAVGFPHWRFVCRQMRLAM